MKMYLVKWEIDIPAESAREAAEQALALLAGGDPKFRMFKVTVSGGHSVAVNLAKPADGS